MPETATAPQPPRGVEALFSGARIDPGMLGGPTGLFGAGADHEPEHDAASHDAGDGDSTTDTQDDQKETTNPPDAGKTAREGSKKSNAETDGSEDETDEGSDGEADEDGQADDGLIEVTIKGVVHRVAPEIAEEIAHRKKIARKLEKEKNKLARQRGHADTDAEDDDGMDGEEESGATGNGHAADPATQTELRQILATGGNAIYDALTQEGEDGAISGERVGQAVAEFIAPLIQHHVKSLTETVRRQEKMIGTLLAIQPEDPEIQLAPRIIQTVAQRYQQSLDGLDPEVLNAKFRARYAAAAAAKRTIGETDVLALINEAWREAWQSSRSAQPPAPSAGNGTQPTQKRTAPPAAGGVQRGAGSSMPAPGSTTLPPRRGGGGPFD